MLLSLSRRLLAFILALGLLAAAPVSAYDSDYDEEEQEVKKPRKKKKGKKKSKKKQSEDDYWDEDSWDDDEVEPVKKKKGKKKKGKKGKNKKKSRKAEEDEDSWDSWDGEDGDSDEVSADDAEDFFADDDPQPAPPESAVQKTALGGAVVRQETPKPAPQVQQPKPQPRPAVTSGPSSRGDCLRMLREGSIDYVEFKVIHPHWTSPVRISREHRVMLALNLRQGAATVLELTERELHVKWDDFPEDRFLRQADGSYKQAAVVKRGGEAMTRKARRVATRLRSRKAVPWEEYGWSGWFMDWIFGDEPPLTYKTLRLVNERMDCKARFSEDEMVLVKMGDGNQAGMVLGYTGVKLHVRWEDGSVVTFKRLEDGSYRKMDDELVARQLLDPNKCEREKSEDNWFQNWWRDVMNEEKPLSYVSVEMKKGKEEYHPRISMDNHVLQQTPPHKGWAKVVKFDRKQLIIRWNGSQEELYERGNDNVYYHVAR